MAEKEDKNVSNDKPKAITASKITLQLVLGLLFAFIAFYVGLFIFPVRMCSSGPMIIGIIFVPLGAIIGAVLGGLCFDVRLKRGYKIRAIAIISAFISGEVVSLLVYFGISLSRFLVIHGMVFSLLWVASIILAASISYNFFMFRIKMDR